MSTTTFTPLPRLIMADTRVPTYPMHSDVADCDVLRYSPDLPDGPFHWAAPGSVKSPTIELTVGRVAELLLIAGIEPESTPAELAAAMHASLELCGCDLKMIAAIAEAYLVEHWECAQRQLDRYTLAAGRAYGLEV